MPDDILPLTTSGQRARAGAALDAATNHLDLLHATLLVDAVDAAVGAMLASAGCRDRESALTVAALLFAP